MAQIHRTICGDLVKININVARKLYTTTDTIIMVKGSKERFNASGISYWNRKGEDDFDTRVNTWLYYNKHHYGNIQFYRDATLGDYKGIRWH